MIASGGERRGGCRGVACGAWLIVAAMTLAAVTGCAEHIDRPGEAEEEQTQREVPTDSGLSDAVVQRVLASTFGISGVACGRTAKGSGFALTSEMVVTNAHVILGMDEIRVRSVDGQEWIATPVAFDPDTDLAILEVPGGGFAPLPLASAARRGTTGMVTGWETGSPDPKPFRIERAVTVRIESVGTTRRIERASWLLSADIELGDSGAALIGPDGTVIGVAFAASKDSVGISYAVRADEVERLMASGVDRNLLIPGCGQNAEREDPEAFPFESMSNAAVRGVRPR